MKFWAQNPSMTLNAPFHNTSMASGSSRDGFHDCNRVLTIGGDVDYTLAMRKAFGEFTERKAVFGNGSPAIKPPRLDWLNKYWQDWQPFLKNQEVDNKTYRRDYHHIGLVEGLTLTDGRSVKIPSELVGMNIRAGESRFFPPIDTTGCASHTDLGEAIEGACAEIIEKNSLLWSWLSKSVARELMLDKKGSKILRILEEKRIFQQIKLYDISFTEDFPTVLAFGITYQKKPYYYVGAGARKNLKEAAHHALLEMFSLGQSYEELFRAGRLPAESFGSFYVDRATQEYFQEDWGYLQSDRIPEMLAQGSGKFTALEALNRLSKKVCAYFYPIDRSSGFHTVKVICPDLFWSLIPLSGCAPLNREKFQNKVLLNSLATQKLTPIPFP